MLADPLTFLSPDFDPSSVTATVLRSALFQYDIHPASNASKADLIKMFNTTIVPKRHFYLQALMKQATPSQQGIVHVTGKRVEEKIEETPRRSSRVSSRLSSVPVERKRARLSEIEQEMERSDKEDALMIKEPKFTSPRKGTSPKKKNTSPRKQATGARKKQKREDRFSDDNPFQRSDDAEKLGGNGQDYFDFEFEEDPLRLDESWDGTQEKRSTFGCAMEPGGSGTQRSVSRQAASRAQAPRHSNSNSVLNSHSNSNSHSKSNSNLNLHSGSKATNSYPTPDRSDQALSSRKASVRSDYEEPTRSTKTSSRQANESTSLRSNARRIQSQEGMDNSPTSDLSEQSRSVKKSTRGKPYKKGDEDSYGSDFNDHTARSPKSTQSNDKTNSEKALTKQAEDYLKRSKIFYERMQTPQSKKSRSSPLRPLLLFLTLFSVYVLLRWKEQSRAIGYCDTDTTPTNHTTSFQLLGVDTPLPAPYACTPCPADAKCAHGRFLRCKAKEYMAHQSSLCRLVSPIMDGLPLVGPRACPLQCVPDTAKLKAVARMTLAIRNYLELYRGEMICQRPYKFQKHQEWQRFALAEPTLRARMLTLKNSHMSREEFDNIWPIAIQDLRLSDRVTHQITDDAAIYAANQAQFSLPCRIKITSLLLLDKLKYYLFTLLSFGIGVAYFYWTRLVESKLNTEAKQLANRAIEQLRQQEYAHQIDRVGTPYGYIAPAHLRDEYLHDLPLQERDKIWSRVSKIINSNSNIREIQADNRGDTWLVWEWIGLSARPQAGTPNSQRSVHFGDELDPPSPLTQTRRLYPDLSVLDE